ncbi:hypothetical protein HNY73_010957 [Argiope bruennichi]|uniref:Uncharacterized protein n=2 Tax=Argiope bruennichi TaxID=94029 RepID=A0A8T0F530_ARGBR|nr:hypothetical protein HNY73_010957 [Argiope bruennichi]
MKPILVFLITMLIADAFCQQLEAYMAIKGIHKFSRIKKKLKDKKFVLYGLGAAVSSVKGAVAGVVSKPLKLIGVVLGPLGTPFKVAGKALKAKSVAEKAKSLALTVKKLSRDSVRYG